MSKKSEYPSNAESFMLESEEKGNIVSFYNALRNKPPVHKGNPGEIEERINEYFNICSDKGVLPTVEGLCVSLGVSRMAVWKWQRDDCEAGRIVENAKSTINAIMSQAALNGVVSFPYAIWLQKNNYGYKDKDNAITEEVEEKKRPLSALELVKLTEHLIEKDDKHT